MRVRPPHASSSAQWSIDDGRTDRLAPDVRRWHARGVPLPGFGAIDHWGSTPEERGAAFPCDDLVPDAAVVLFRAIDVDAPAPLTFRWLCQLRVAPYSYDRIDHGGRRSPRTLTPGLEHLEIGQRFMTIFRLAGFEPDRSITLTSDGTVFERVAATYRVVECPDERSRIVAKVLAKFRPGPRGWLKARLLPAGDLVMMRRQLRTLADLAARDARDPREAGGPPTPTTST
jgi:hypothetical protein